MARTTYVREVNIDGLYLAASLPLPGADGGNYSRNNAVTILFVTNALQVLTKIRDYYRQLHIDVDACIMPMND